MVPYRMFDAIEHHALLMPDQIMVDSEGSTISYAKAERKISQLIAGFAELGIQQSDRVAVISRNGPEILMCLLAALRGGPVLVPINHRLAAPEIQWQLNDAQCVAVIAESQFVDLIAEAPLDGVHRFEINGERPGWTSFNRWWDSHADVVRSEPRDPAHPYLQIYTSGTTGRAKGVLLSEANCVAAILAAFEGIDAPVATGEITYQGFPLFHIGGVFVTLWLLSKGLSLAFLRDFNPAQVDAMLSSGRIDHAAMVPAMIQGCVSVKPMSTGTARLKTMFYGASPINESVLTRARARYQCDFVQVYGMTETHSIISCLTVADHRLAIEDGRKDLIRSAGRPLPGCDVQIVDPSSREPLERGAVGEICVRGRQITQGYWLRPDATAETIVDGLLFTGDAGYLDCDGYLFIVDRLKDIIVSGGENVSSKEVEDVLHGFAGVKEAAVIGVPDLRWGESVKALVVSAETTLDLDKLMAHCREHLGGFKVPKSIEQIEMIPRNGAGKVLKHVLREPYWKGVDRRVS